MNDGYPRVVEDFTRPVSYRVWSEADPEIGGRWKVVPADAIVTLPSERRTLPEVTSELGVKVVGADAAVFERADLPIVRNLRTMQRFEAGQSYADWDDEPEYFEARAREYMALAMRLRQEREPAPVDEVQVNQMLADISVAYSAESGTPRAKVLARRLVEQGWTKKPAVES